MPSRIPFLDEIVNTRSGAGAKRPAPSPIQPPQSSIISNALPGSEKLTSAASGIVDNLLKGLPGTSTARRANAFYGGASGMPGSDFVRNRGFDLYNMQGEQQQQKGIENLLAMISSYSQPALQERGQDIQSGQFTQNLGEQQYQFDNENALRRQQTNFLYPRRKPSKGPGYQMYTGQFNAPTPVGPFQPT